MKQVLLFFILTPTFVAAQFGSYEQDSLKVYKVLDENDGKKKEILEESLAIIKTMLDLTYEEVLVPEDTEDFKLKLATFRILAAIYKNAETQIPFYRERVKLSEQMKEDLANLKIVQESTNNNYKVYRKKIGWQRTINSYKRKYRYSERVQRLLTADIREILNNVYEKAYRKDLVGEFINYYSLTVKGIDKLKVQPTRDSLKKNIHKTELHLTELSEDRDTLMAKLKNLNGQETKLKNQNNELKIQLANNKIEIEKKEELLKNRQVDEQALEKKLTAVQAILSERTNALTQAKISFLALEKEMQKTEKEMELKQDSLSILERKNKFFSRSNASLAQVELDSEKEISTLKKEIFELVDLKKNKNQLSLFLLLSIGGLIGFSYRLKQSKDMSKVQTILMQKLKVTNRQLKDKTAELKLSHKELQHRTKNNLQKIINLIYLKKFSIKDKQARGILELLQNELDTIALIHQKLYVKENQKLTTVNVADYVDELVRCIVGEAAAIQTNVEDIYIEMDNAVEIGLILNELVTNACKYGFKEVDQPEISLDIYVQDEFIFINLRDNGLGFPDGISIAENASFGLMAIADIVKRHEHKGSNLQLFNDNGAVVALQLPFDKKRSRLAA